MYADSLTILVKLNCPFDKKEELNPLRNWLWFWSQHLKYQSKLN